MLILLDLSRSLARYMHNLTGMDEETRAGR